MFSPEGPRKNVWGPHENVSPGPAVALDGPGITWENTTSEISLFNPMRYDCLINIMRKNTFCSHFWHFGWHLIQLSIFSTACSKIRWSVGPLCEHRQGDTFSIHWQRYRLCSAPDQSRLYQSLLDFTNIPKPHLVDTLPQDSQTL